MSAGRSSDPRTAQERAEQFMERVAADASQRLTRFMGRAREEFEDILAEARTRNQRQQQGRSGSASKLPSSSGSDSNR
jgi:hypothetical protein